MKKITYWFSWIFLLCGMSLLATAQEVVEIENTKAGGLAELLNAHKNIEALTISGVMNGDDFAALRKQDKVSQLDLSGVTIVAGGGYKAMYEEIVAEAGVFPGCFCFDAPITTSIKSIVFPSSVTKIGLRAMQNAEKLHEITWPEELTHISDMAFGYCDALESVELPESVTHIGGSAFSFCKALKEIELPEGLNYIGGSAFKKSSSLAKIKIPEGVDSILYSTFDGCVALKEIEIGYFTKTIENFAFSGCVALEEIKLPYLLRNVGREAFKGCTALSKVTFQGNGVKKIGDGAFQNCESLTEIVLPAEVLSIGGNAFLGCTKLENVILPAHLEILMGGAFAGTMIQSIRIPDSIKEINYAAFARCGELESVRLGSGIEKLGENVFGLCPKLKSVDLGAVNPPMGKAAGDMQGLESLATIKDLVLYVPEGSVDRYKQANGWKAIGTIQAGKSLTLTISEEKPLSDQLENIEKSDITTLVLKGAVASDDVELLHEFAILRKLDLTGATLDDSFSCQGFRTIEEVLLPETYTQLANSLFEECLSLKKVTFSSKATSIGESTFSNCRWLEEVQLPTTVSEIGESAFAGCTSLRKIQLPDAIEFVSDYLFQECTSLGEVVLGKELSDIGTFAFFNNMSLKEILLPAKVAEIKKYAFYGCDQLSKITSHNPEPPEVESDTFDPMHYSKVVIFVPDESAKATYAEHEIWQLFKQYKLLGVDPITVASLDVRVLSLPQAIRIVNQSGKILEARIYNMMGQQIATLNVADVCDYAIGEGAYLVQIGGNAYKVLIL